jgi:hypothetical protein
MVPKAPLVTSSSDTIPSSDMTTIDFNRTLNPPCAFTSYIACSLPPKCNYLPLRIEAGERRYVTTMAQRNLMFMLLHHSLLLLLQLRLFECPHLHCYCPHCKLHCKYISFVHRF